MQRMPLLQRVSGSLRCRTTSPSDARLSGVPLSVSPTASLKIVASYTMMAATPLLSSVIHMHEPTDLNCSCPFPHSTHLCLLTLCVLLACGIFITNTNFGGPVDVAERYQQWHATWRCGCQTSRVTSQSLAYPASCAQSNTVPGLQLAHLSRKYGSGPMDPARVRQDCLCSRQACITTIV